jgi:hypothetical protein
LEKSYLNGITIIGDKQHVDHYTCATCYAKLRKPSGLQGYSLIVQLGFSTGRREAQNKCFSKQQHFIGDKAW